MIIFKHYHNFLSPKGYRKMRFNNVYDHGESSAFFVFRRTKMCCIFLAVAGRSPMLNRRYRMPPPSPTPVSRYQLSQLPSWRTDALAMEKSPSSISSSSTIKETKEQSLPPMQPPLPSTTSPKLAPKRQEMEERLPPAPPPRQQPLVRAPIRVAQTRGVYDTHARIPMTYSNSPYRVPSPPSPSRNAAEGKLSPSNFFVTLSRLLLCIFFILRMVHNFFSKICLDTDNLIIGRCYNFFL